MWSAIWPWLLGLVSIVLAVVLTLSYAPHLARDGLSKLGDVSEIGSAMLAPPLIERQPSKNCFWMKQNWSDEERAWFHNVSQGTATFPVPYAWFRGLERPDLSPFDPLISRDLISDSDYLERLGFISPNTNCDPPAKPSMPEGYGKLPVGFAVLKGGTDPVTGQRMEDGLGLTCAACHTGRVFYKDTELRIDGAPAMIDIGNLERVIGLSVCYSDMLPWRNWRLVNSLTEATPAPDDAHDRTTAQLNDICREKIRNKVKLEREVLARRHETHAEEGFGRLDALNRIGNQVFHEDLLPLPEKDPADPEREKKAILALDANFAAHTAPVSFPPIWDVPHFVWAQYDASILNPGIRNIGEALGVSARVNMLNSSDPSLPLFASSVDFDAIEKIEGLLLGSTPPFEGEVGFKGLQAPRWEEAASHFPDDDNWKIEPDEVIEEGRGLYRELCVECHHSPPRDITISLNDTTSFWNEENWISIGNEKLFNNTLKTVAAIGTDPEQARVLTERTVRLPSYLEIDTRTLMEKCEMLPDSALEKSFALSLMEVVARVREQQILEREKRDRRPLTEAEKASFRGSRPNCPNPIIFARFESASDVKRDATAAARSTYIATPHYRARPLDGVWATAPYLHNGSVPTLDDLLSPQWDRPKAFCVGPMQFDTKRVGLMTPTSKTASVECEEGMTLFDVTKRGNSNLGHSFEGSGANLAAGVIGRGLDPEERAKLIAYLKTL
ncbi:di-heme-cytochrome C peroxidase (plasmid) [Rhizobium leguminosarum]